MSYKSFPEELQDHLNLVAENNGNATLEFQRIMNITFVIRQLHLRGLTIDELDDYKPLIVQECKNSNFSTSKATIDLIYQIIKS